MSLSTSTNPLGESLCFIWRSRLTNSVGGFSGQWNYYINLDYWLRLTLRGDLIVISKQLGSFRITSSSWTSWIGLSAVSEARKFYVNH